MLKYHNIGLKEFYENFEEIMLYYKQKRKAKADLIDMLIDNKASVWTSKIPVYSTVLRHQALTEESYYFNSLDKQIYPLTSISIKLRDAAAIEVPLYLIQAQQRVNELWGLNFSLIDGKHGWIRSQCVGGMFNFSGRNVIVLDPTLGIDQVDVSYKTFLIEYGSLIIKRIKKDKNWTTTRAHNFLKSKFQFDDYVYKIMLDIIEEEKPEILANRNPGSVTI